MDKGKKSQIIVIIALVLVVVVMSIGYAAIGSELTANGNIELGVSKWDVHFVTSGYSESLTPTEGTSATHEFPTTTQMTYNVTLNNPGDTYEATVPIKNDGTIDAILKSISMSISGTNSDHVTYDVTIDSTKYTSSNTNVMAHELSKNGGTYDVKIKLSYNVPTENEDLLPEGATGITATLTLGYIQDSNS